jgi:hypothetical protein
MVGLEVKLGGDGEELVAHAVLAGGHLISSGVLKPNIGRK